MAPIQRRPQRGHLVGCTTSASPGLATPFCKYGGDLFYLSQNGLFPLSKALQSATVNYQTALTAKIDTAFTEAVSTYGANSGWYVTAYPEGSLVLVNIPIALDTSIQYVMNSITGAWCVFKGWNATLSEVSQQKLYFWRSQHGCCRAGSRVPSLRGLSDNGAGHRWAGTERPLALPALQAVPSTFPHWPIAAS